MEWNEQGGDKMIQFLIHEGDDSVGVATVDIKAGETTADKQFTLETVNCLGACALGPMVIVGENYHGEMTPETIGSVLESYT